MLKLSGLIPFAAFFLSLAACTPVATHTYSSSIPLQSDWVDCGLIFSAGAEGEWDYYLWGGFAATVVKKDGIFYLYYQGSDGYDDDEHTVTWRSIGVATSSDGVHFTKYEQNPVLTWFPNNNLEEGAVSGGAFLDTTGEIAIYYGANRWIGGSEVNADGRLATSLDGFNFTDQGVVLDHSDSAVWGSGDELFPIVGFQDNGRWVTYYIPNGVPQRGQLGVAWGNSRDNLTNSAAARSNTNTISVWGPGSFAQIDDNQYALFTNDVYGPSGPVLEVRIVSSESPSDLSLPVRSYQFDNVWEAVVFLDEESDIWYMYYRSTDHEHYGVKIAASAGQEISCPVQQQQLYLPFIGYETAVHQYATCTPTSGVR